MCRWSRNLGGVGLIRFGSMWLSWIYSSLREFSQDGVKIKRQTSMQELVAECGSPRGLNSGRNLLDLVHVLVIIAVPALPSSGSCTGVKT